MSDEKLRGREYVPAGPVRIAPIKRNKIQVNPTKGDPAGDVPREVDSVVYEKKEKPAS